MRNHWLAGTPLETISEANEMRIGLIDVDGHRFPNLPLMKLSAWHKAQGDSVEWYEPLFSGHLDRVYMSKVFSFTPDYEYFVDADEVIRTVLERKEKMNARAYELIKEKRQSNPNYGRPEREWSKGKWKWRKKNV